MDSKDTILYAFFGAVLLVLVGALALQYAENREMRRVLIGHTIAELDRRYDAARRVEEAEVATLRSSLAEALDHITTIQGLSQTERELIGHARSLVDRLIHATTVKGLSFE